MEKKKIEDLEIIDKVTRGKVVSIAEEREVVTKFGNFIRFVLNVQVGGSVVPISLLVSKKVIETQLIHPRSNLYRLLTKYGCKKLRDIVGKEVEVTVDARGFYRLVI